ncbi:hypothetical protein D3C85_1013080 [compost metagenome]
MKTGLVRRFHRFVIVPTERIREIEHARVELRQRAARAFKIKQDHMRAAAQQNRMFVGVDAMQEVGMRLDIKHILDLFQLRHAHKLQ